MVDASGAPIDEDDASSSDGEPEIGLEGLRPEALAARREVLGPRHRHTLAAMGSLALTLRKQGKKAEAEALKREVLAAK